DRVDCLDGAEARHVDDRRAQLDGREHHRRHTECMEQRDDAEELVLALEIAMRDRGIDIALEIAVGQRNPLGLPARAAGVHQHGDIVGCRSVRRRIYRAACSEWAKLCEVHDLYWDLLEASCQWRN